MVFATQLFYKTNKKRGSRIGGSGSYAIKMQFRLAQML
jgi:hypothetical protein